jgi:methenyltetrahydrofolate cyclohydrolase
VRGEPIQDWLAALAGRTPAPGGGAAAALSAATAASLVSMVAVYTTGERWADRSEQMEAVDAEATELRLLALDLAAADAVAFEKVGAAYAMPNDGAEAEAARASAIQAALVGAAEPPRQVGEAALRIVDLAAGLLDSGNPNVISDVAVAASNGRAALEAAIVNIEINRASIADEAVGEELAAAIEALTAGIEKADATVAGVRAKLTA